MVHDTKELPQSARLLIVDGCQISDEEYQELVDGYMSDIGRPSAHMVSGGGTTLCEVGELRQPKGPSNVAQLGCEEDVNRLFSMISKTRCWSSTRSSTRGKWMASDGR